MGVSGLGVSMMMPSDLAGIVVLEDIAEGFFILHFGIKLHLLFDFYFER